MDTELFWNMPDEELFSQARRRSVRKPLFQASPILWDTRCEADPPCRHCKWESFKNTGRIINTRLTNDQAVARARFLEEKGVDRAFLATGWLGCQTPPALAETVSAIKESTSLELYALLGAVDRASLKLLKNAGLDGFLCGLESPNEQAYRSFRPGGDSLTDRIRALDDAAELGLAIWSGFLLGLGETQEDCRHGIELLSRYPLESLSILPFMPFPDTPMYRAAPPAPYYMARIMAIAGLILAPKHVFVDQEGSYGIYGRLADANGVYAHPEGNKKSLRR